MKINFVSRQDITISKKSSSKYKPLLEAVQKLKPGGKALEVTFSDDTELNSMRNVVYSYNRETGEKIRSSKHPKKNLVYFYKEKNS
ncbi:MAG: hypothetical protein R3281_09530 [Balneolaceae bacterium]|nr:hypothetical protein [Balneolaceae bacterium]